MEVPEELPLAYVAGLFDGEGWVGISPTRRNAWYLRAGIGLTVRPVLYSLQLQFGGSLANAKAIEGRKQSYNWTLTHNDAVPFLEQVLPHLWIKRAEAELVLEYMQHRDQAEEYRDRLKALRNPV